MSIDVVVFGIYGHTHLVHFVAGEFSIIDSAINPMKGVTTEAAMQYRRRLGTRRVYMPTMRKRQRDTTVR
jgi:hypothetical protein